MAQSTTNLGKIHVFPSETLYNQFKDIIADNDLALLKDDGAYIVAALLEQNGYVKFSNGLILQWGVNTNSFPISVSEVYSINATKKDTGTNSVPDVREYSSTGFCLLWPITIRLGSCLQGLGFCDKHPPSRFYVAISYKGPRCYVRRPRGIPKLCCFCGHYDAVYFANCDRICDCLHCR